MIRGGICELHAAHAPGNVCLECLRAAACEVAAEDGGGVSSVDDDGALLADAILTTRARGTLVYGFARIGGVTRLYQPGRSRRVSP